MDVGTELSVPLSGARRSRSVSRLWARPLTVFTLGAAALALTSVGLVAIVWRAAGGADPIGMEPIAAMSAAAAVAALPAAILFALRASESDPFENMSVALGLLVLGLGHFGLAELVPVLSDATPGFTVWGAWSLGVALLLLATGLLAGLARPLVAVAMLLIAAAALVGVVGGWHAERVIGIAGLGTLILGYGCAYRRSGRPHFLWLAVGFIGYLLGSIASNGSDELWALVAGVERLLGSLILLGGLGAELAQSTRYGRERLAEAELRMRELRDVAQATQRLVEERDHDARSALSAIEHTAHALRQHASLEPATIDELERALSAELALLRRLIALPSPTGLTEFSVAGAIDGVVVAERLAGLSIDVSIPADLVAFGDPDATAQVVQNLLENCRRHAAGSPVAILGGENGPWVVLKVEDSGPGIPSDRWREVLRRGHDGGHPSAAGGSGLGLFIAERLMREQRGFLWVDSAPRGGASIRLALAAVDGTVADQASGPAAMAGEAIRSSEVIPTWSKR